jgi:hypothetical protein
MPIDYKQYHPKWSLISRLIRFRRAQNCCEWCAAPNNEPHPKTGKKVTLTVAHIDRDRRHNRFSNLVALCQPCHFKHDRKDNIRNRRYGKNHKYNNYKLVF